MHFEKFLRKPSVVVSFTLEELNLLMWAASMHYDFTCKEAGHLGGFLYGMDIHAKLGAELRPAELPTHTLDFRQIDLLAKISESLVASDRVPKLETLHRMLLHLLEELNKEYLRLNQ